MHPKHLFRLLPIAIVLGMSIGFGWQYFQEQQATRLDYDHPSPLPTQPSHNPQLSALLVNTYHKCIIMAGI